MSEMETGFNSDIVQAGKSYHVQTEDWGESNPFVVTRVFCSGTVITSVKTSYQDIISRSSTFGRQAVRLAMRDQHQRILDQLVNGTLVGVRLK